MLTAKNRSCIAMPTCDQAIQKHVSMFTQMTGKTDMNGSPRKTTMRIVQRNSCKKEQKCAENKFYQIHERLFA